VSNQITVYKNRTNVKQVDLGFDVSGDVITSEIRAGKSVDSDLIATWTVEFVNDGTDGLLTLTIDDSDLTDVTVHRGYMDMKRVSAGEPIGVFTQPIKVRFKDVVTE